MWHDIHLFLFLLLPIFVNGNPELSVLTIITSFSSSSPYSSSCGSLFGPVPFSWGIASSSSTRSITSWGSFLKLEFVGGRLVLAGVWWVSVLGIEYPELMLLRDEQIAGKAKPNLLHWQESYHRLEWYWDIWPQCHIRVQLAASCIVHWVSEWAGYVLHSTHSSFLKQTENSMSTGAGAAIIRLPEALGEFDWGFE